MTREFGWYALLLFIVSLAVGRWSLQPAPDSGCRANALGPDWPERVGAMIISRTRQTHSVRVPSTLPPIAQDGTSRIGRTVLIGSKGQAILRTKFVHRAPIGSHNFSNSCSRWETEETRRSLEILGNEPVIFTARASGVVLAEIADVAVKGNNCLAAALMPTVGRNSIGKLWHARFAVPIEKRKTVSTVLGLGNTLHCRWSAG